MQSGSNLVVGTSHIIQGRQQSYVIVRRLLTIHSEDRDTGKWPSASHFEVQLPDPITNVQSMRMLAITIPQNLYVFSRAMQNTRMWVSDETSKLADMQELEIQEGTYTPDQLALELQCRLIELGYTGTKVLFDKVSLRFWFSFPSQPKERPVFHFQHPPNYLQPAGHTDPVRAESQCTGLCARPCWGRTVEQTPDAWDRCMKWGLGWYLGFNEKAAVTPEPVPSGGLVFGWRARCTDPCATEPQCTPWADEGEYYIAAPCPSASRIMGDTAIYVEVDKYNMYDELVPQGINSSAMFNRTGGGTVNAAFAKIAITSPFGSRIIDPDQQELQNVQQFDPPLERIQKLKFKIRYHDGRPVDFRGEPFDITMEFNQLRDEIKKNYTVRVPPLYH